MIKVNLQLFGGRGASSSGGGGGGGGSAKGELVLPNGSKIEFDGELKYGKKDPTLTPEARKAIETWETKRGTAKVEYAYSVYEDGTPVGNEVRGGKGSVRSPYSYHGEGATFTHIHPRGDGMLGGTFSQADMNNFANCKSNTTRAKAKEGTYSISKTGNFDATGFKSYVAKAQADFKANQRQSARTLANDYRSGKINYNEYLAGSAKAFNTALVKLHDTYSAGQKTYGYTYTLEKN